MKRKYLTNTQPAPKDHPVYKDTTARVKPAKPQNTKDKNV